MSISIGDALQQASQRLQAISDAPQREARWLLGDILGQPNAWLLLHSTDLLSEAAWQQFDTRLARRETGYPLPYIVGNWSFYRWEFVVNEHVLIPRPETEQLVELAYAWAQQQPHQQPLRIVDVGTGSGVIAVSLAKLLPAAQVIGVDISAEALKIARLNAQRLGATHVQFVQSHLLTALSPNQPFDMVVANLPYINSGDLAQLAVAHHEPHLALDGGPDGLNLIRQLLDQLPHYLAQNGVCVLEIGAEQGVAFRHQTQHAGLCLSVHQDFAGRDRFVIVKLEQDTPCL